MDDAAPMSMRGADCGEDGPHDAPTDLQRLRSVLIDPDIERWTLDALHHQPRHARADDVRHPSDVRVLQLGHQPALLKEPVPQRRLRRQV